MAVILQTTFSSGFSWIENACTSIKISLKFGPGAPINNISALVQTVAWHRPGDKLLCEPMMASLVLHIQYVSCNLSELIDSCKQSMRASSNGNIFRVTGLLCGEFSGPRWIPLTKASFDVFFDLCLNKQVSKQSWGWRSETPSSSLWRQCNDDQFWKTNAKKEQLH